MKKIARRRGVGKYGLGQGSAMDSVESLFVAIGLQTSFYNVTSNLFYFSSVLILNKSRLAKSRQILPVLKKCYYVTFRNNLSYVSG